jgi:hypothetical protein
MAIFCHFDIALDMLTLCSKTIENKAPISEILSNILKMMNIGYLATVYNRSGRRYLLSLRTKQAFDLEQSAMVQQSR